MSRQKGMALLIVLLLLGMMAVMAVSITGFWNNAFEHTETSQNRLNARWLLLGGKRYAVKQLLSDMPLHLSVHLQQNWARQDLALRNDGDDMMITFRDGQGCFNINAVSYRLSEAEQKQNIPPDVKEGDREKMKSTPEDMARQVFTLLLQNLGADMQQSLNITAQVEKRLGNSNAPLFGDVSELRALPGMTRELYQQLAPQVCALPVRKPAININTLSKKNMPLLLALFLNEPSDRVLRTFIDERPAEGWNGSGDPDLLEKLNKLKLPPHIWTGFLVTGSRYFLLDVQLKPRYASETYYLQSLLQYDRKSNQVATLWQYTGQVYHQTGELR